MEKNEYEHHYWMIDWSYFVYCFIQKYSTHMDTNSTRGWLQNLGYVWGLWPWAGRILGVPYLGAFIYIVWSLIVTSYSKPGVLRIYSNPKSHWTYAVKLTIEYFLKYSFFRVGVVVVKVIVYHVLNYLPLITQAAFSSTLDRFFTNSCASLSPTREARMSRAPFSTKKTLKCISIWKNLF